MAILTPTSPTLKIAPDAQSAHGHGCHGGISQRLRSRLLAVSRSDAFQASIRTVGLTPGHRWCGGLRSVKPAVNNGKGAPGLVHGLNSLNATSIRPGRISDRPRKLAKDLRNGHLEGLGGTGKSTALLDWARRIVESPSPRLGALTSIVIASEIRPNLINEIVCDWFALPNVHHIRRNDTSAIAIERLSIALPDPIYPVFLLGLDGVDEGAAFTDRPRAVRDTLKWF